MPTTNRTLKSLAKDYQAEERRAGRKKTLRDILADKEFKKLIRKLKKAKGWDEKKVILGRLGRNVSKTKKLYKKKPDEGDAELLPDDLLEIRIPKSRRELMEELQDEMQEEYKDVIDEEEEGEEE
jgi:hypothetical protein